MEKESENNSLKLHFHLNTFFFYSCFSDLVWEHYLELNKVDPESIPLCQVNCLITCLLSTVWPPFLGIILKSFIFAENMELFVELL